MSLFPSSMASDLLPIFEESVKLLWRKRTLPYFLEIATWGISIFKLPRREIPTHFGMNVERRSLRRRSARFYFGHDRHPLILGLVSGREEEAL